MSSAYRFSSALSPPSRNIASEISQNKEEVQGFVVFLHEVKIELFALHLLLASQLRDDDTALALGVLL